MAQENTLWDAIGRENEEQKAHFPDAEAALRRPETHVWPGENQSAGSAFERPDWKGAGIRQPWKGCVNLALVHRNLCCFCTS